MISDPYKGLDKNVLVEHLLATHHYDREFGAFYRKKKGTSSKNVGERSEVVDGHGYKSVHVLNKLFLAHRLVWLLEKGEMPKGSLDHINQDNQDNRISNLRLVSHAENMKNKKRYANNSQGITGVYWRKDKKNWNPQIRSNNKLYSLGYFNDFFEACCARKSAEINFNFSSNHGSA